MFRLARAYRVTAADVLRWSPDELAVNEDCFLAAVAELPTKGATVTIDALDVRVEG